MTAMTCTLPVRFGIIKDYDYSATHKRERLTIWAGMFDSEYIGEAYSMPKRDGYRIFLEYGDTVNVYCPHGRDDDNYQEIDKAINDALNVYRQGKAGIR